MEGIDTISPPNSEFRLVCENCFTFSSSEDERCSCGSQSIQNDLNLDTIESPSSNFHVGVSHNTEIISFTQKVNKNKDSYDKDDECNDEDDPLADYRNSVWKKKSINLLLHLCKEHKSDFCDYSKKKKYIWETIAEKLRFQGYTVTADTCDTKWRNMLKTYRKTLKYNEQPDVSPRKCPFFDQIKEVLSEHSIKKQSKELLTQGLQEKYGYLVHKRTGVIWDTKALKLLISAYKEHKNDFSDDRIKKRYVWKKVSEFMNKKGCIVPPDSCEAKWKNLLRKFKHTLDEKGQPTNETHRSPLYQEIMELMNSSQNHSGAQVSEFNSNVRSVQQWPERRKPIGFMWELQSTKLLISLYAEKSMNYTEQKKSKLWISIAQAMCEQGYSVTPTTCDAKWRKMLKIYKSALQYKRRTGNIPTKCWFFDEMKELNSQFLLHTKTKSAKRCKNNFIEKVHRNVHRKHGSHVQELGDSKKIDIIGWLDNRKAEQDKREKEKLDVLMQMHKERMELMGMLIQVLKT